MSSQRTPANPAPDTAAQRLWVVSIYRVKTDALLAEHTAASVDASSVRALWKLSEDDPPRPLLVTADKLEFVNKHLAEPVELKADEEIYLEEYEG